METIMTIVIHTLTAAYQNSVYHGTIDVVSMAWGLQDRLISVAAQIHTGTVFA